MLVIGRPTEEVWDRVVKTERSIGREINVKRYTRAEVERLRRNGDRFIRSADAGRTLTLVGPEQRVGR